MVAAGKSLAYVFGRAEFKAIQFDTSCVEDASNDL